MRLPAPRALLCSEPTRYGLASDSGARRELGLRRL